MNMMCDFEEEAALVVSEDFNKDGIPSSTNYGHCHIEAKNDLEINPIDQYDIPRHEVKRVICSICSTEQNVQQNCTNCGVCMGNEI